MKITRLDFPDFKVNQVTLQNLFKNLPTWSGNAALNFYLDSFRRQGFINKRFKRWKTRKNDPNPNRNILIGKASGRLRRSLRLSVSTDGWQVSANTPYSKIHNEGGKILQIVTPRQRRFFWAMYHKNKKQNPEAANRFKAMALSKKLNINIPQRQFMDIPGKQLSPFLLKRIIKHVERGITFALD